MAVKKDFVDVAAAGGREDYASLLRKIKESGKCPFCSEELQHFEKPILREGPRWLARDNAFPYAGSQHHFLLLHKEHIEHVNEMSSEAWAELFVIIQWLCKEYAIPGASFFMRFGDMNYTAASVNHVHGQLLMGFSKQEAPYLLAPPLGFSTIEFIPPKK